MTPTNPPQADAAPVTTAARARGLLAAAAGPWVWALAVLGAALIAAPAEDGVELQILADEMIAEMDDWSGSSPIKRRAVTVAVIPGGEGPPGWSAAPWHPVAVRSVWYGRTLGGVHEREWLAEDQIRSLHLPAVGLTVARGNDLYWEDLYVLTDLLRDPLYDSVHESAVLFLSPLLMIGPLLLASAMLAGRQMRRGPTKSGRAVMTGRRLSRPWVFGAAEFAAGVLITTPRGDGAGWAVQAETFPAAGWRPLGLWEREITVKRLGDSVRLTPEEAAASVLDPGLHVAAAGLSLWEGWETRWFFGKNLKYRTAGIAVSVWWLLAAGLVWNATTLLRAGSRWRGRRGSAMTGG